MLAGRIWVIAQVINLVIMSYLFSDFGGLFNLGIIIILPFTAAGGMPALGVFAAWTTYLRKVHLPPAAAVLVALILFPAATACCSYGLASALEFGSEIQEFAMPPVIATAISVLLHSRVLAKYHRPMLKVEIPTISEL